MIYFLKIILKKHCLEIYTSNFIQWGGQLKKWINLEYLSLTITKIKRHTLNTISAESYVKMYYNVL